MLFKKSIRQVEMIVALIFILAITCKKIELPHSANDDILRTIDSVDNCIHFVHPEWIDEITYNDTIIDNYNAIILKAYLRNDCIDTISLGITGHRITSSTMNWFCGDQSFGESIFDKSERFQIVIPGDSIYLYISELRDVYVDKFDSVLVAVDYRMNNILRTKMIKINGDDLVTRE